ncbi:NucA/NucB deoxyribonuclease domain-containing protein [Streptomyces sp. NPDC002309]
MTWFRRRAVQAVAVMLPAALLTAAPSAAAAEDADRLRVETYVLPFGAAKPSLEELQNGNGTERLRQLAAAAEPEAQLAQETVGPAASYASLSTRASGSPSASLGERAGATAAAGPRATAPDPARKMSLDECAKGLGTDKKFFVKSRFAVCNGASFVQTWFRNNRPVGESMFNVRVIGTVALNSRTISYAYHFSDFFKGGSNAADGLSITTKGNTPQSWPSGVRYTRGGDLPAGARTFAQLRAQGTFKQTVLAKPGQGTGSADLVFAVYEPSVRYTAPAPWNLNGNGGNLFMLAPRWDAASYLANSTGGGNPVRKGAATFSYITPLALSAKPGAEERAEAQHIRQAFLVPQDTKPYMSAKKVPGQTAKEPLHRTVSESRNKKNRAAAVKQCKRYWGPNYTSGGKECDEYPFASTYEGAAEVEYDPEAKKFNFSAKPIPGDDNQAGGLILKSYYAKNRIIDGLNDGFTVKIVT